MWLFTPFGFFSVVQHLDDADLLLVRARVRADLEALASRLGETTEVLHTPAADYPYRFAVPRTALSRAVSEFIDSELHYPNFKAEVERAQGVARELAYERVWGVLRGVEDSGSRRTFA